jgi:hypothetical protein
MLNTQQYLVKCAKNIPLCTFQVPLFLVIENSGQCFPSARQRKVVIQKWYLLMLRGTEESQDGGTGGGVSQFNDLPLYQEH